MAELIPEIVFSSAVTLEFRRDYPVPADVVWRALTDSAEISAWMGIPCTLDLRPGGLFTLDVNQPIDNAVVCSVIPQRVLVTMFRETLIFQTLDDHGDSTTHCFRQIGVPPESATSFACGWHHLLDRLAGHIAGDGSEVSIEGIEARYEEQFRAFAQTHGMMRPT